MKARLFIAAAFLAVVVTPLPAATITVTSTADNGPGSLRDALASAADEDTIDASGVSGTILLTNGELLVTNSVDIVGPGPDLLAVNGNGARWRPNGNRVFHVGPSNTVIISGLTVTHGEATGLTIRQDLGGGIYNDHSALIISNCVVSGNWAGEVGGGVYNDGSMYDGATLEIADSTLSGSWANEGGGCIGNDGNDGTATMLIVNSTISSNSSNFYGGGIENSSELLPSFPPGGGATLILSNSTVSGNYIRLGPGAGGIHNSGATLQIINSILNGNRGANGGAICNDDGELGRAASVQLINSIVIGNSAGYGGGIENQCGYGTTTVQIVSSTVSSNMSYKGGAIDNSGSGAGLAIVEITNSTLIGNSATEDGGGVYNEIATLEIVNSTLSSNSAPDGGGINNAVGTTRVLNSTLSRNLAANGGGVFTEGYLEIRNSVLNGNSATNGNAIYNYSNYGFFTAAVQIVNSTLSDNSATNTEFGSDIYNYGDSVWYGSQALYQGIATLQIVNSTLNVNSATNAILNSGIYNVAHAPGTAIVMIASTILDAGISGLTVTNDSGTFTSLGYNLSSDDGGSFLTATGDQINTDPMLGPLQDNGGPTLTCALLCGSPAIDQGTNFSGAATDQRGNGFVRTFDDCAVPNATGGDGTDIGAFEVQMGECPHPPIISCPTNQSVNARSPAGARVNYRAPVASNGCPVSVVCNPPSGSLFAIGDTIVSCIATDTEGNEATCHFNVHVKGPAEQINDLIVLVRSLNLKPWTAYVLTAELQSASNALRRGNTRAACGDLDAFIFEVDVQTWWRQIWPPSRARLLLTPA